MQLDILKRILTNTPKEQALALYNAMTGENATQEDLDLATKPKKKQNILTIEKELLNSYCEAVSDLKKIRNAIIDEESCGYISDVAIDEFKPLQLLNEIIDKHVERIKSSGIWR